MWSVKVVFLCCVLAQAASHNISVVCEVFDGLPPTNSHSTPSPLMALKAEDVLLNGTPKTNISWAIRNDVTVKDVTGLRISGSLIYGCEYIPRLTESAFEGRNERWFYFLAPPFSGSSIQASNLPLPIEGNGDNYILTDLVPLPPPAATPAATPTFPPLSASQEVVDKRILGSKTPVTSIVTAMFGGLAGLMILGSFCIIYKHCRSFSSSLGFEKLAPVSVLLVYPPENPAFQRAVVALAEFLQWHGGCNVAIDLWQQGKIAELGPLRWLAEQAKAAERVLIICPTVDNQSSKSSDYPPLLKHSSQESSIPAAAHDLYPLILNMVASHAKSADELAKFWVVRLGEQQGNRLSNLTPELRACTSFCLMKDLNKLCWSLYSQRQDEKNNSSNQFFRPGLGYNEMITFKLREGIENLTYSREPMKSVVVTV